MSTYARIEAGRVVEMLELDCDPSSMFHPSLVWEVVGPMLSGEVCVNWTYAGGVFSSPPLAPAAAQPPSILDSLQAQIDTLAASLAALQKAR